MKNKNKKKYLYLILSAVLVFLSAYIFVNGWAAAREDFDLTKHIVAFSLCLLLQLIYYLWLVLSRRLETKWNIFYAPATGLLFFAAVLFLVFAPYKRGLMLNLGEDPFVPGTTISSSATFYFWEKEFYLPKETVISEAEAEQIAAHQITRQGSLISHVGTSLQGWSTEKTRSAFGEPDQIIQMNAGIEKWIYHPWTEESTWEMPVYVQNGVLVKVGD